MTEPTAPVAPKKPSAFRVAYNAFISWAETPTGKHTLIAIAAALGTAVEQGIRAVVGH